VEEQEGKSQKEEETALMSREISLHFEKRREGPEERRKSSKKGITGRRRGQITWNNVT